MKTVGDVLRDARERSGLTPAQLERLTRIREDYIKAIELGDYKALPPPTFVKGFIRNIGRELGLNVQQLLALYRREYDERSRSTTRLAPEPLYRSNLRLTPKNAFFGVVILFVLFFFGYLYNEYRSLSGAPLLVVAQPADQAQVQGPGVVVSGKTYPDARVTINGQEVIVSPDGTFKTEMKSSQEVTTITVVAASKRGKKNTVTRIVRVINPER